MESRSSLASPGVRAGSARGAFGVRSGSVRGPLGICSGSVQGPRGVCSGSVRHLFEGRTGFMRGPCRVHSASVRAPFGVLSGPFGVRSESVRGPKRKTPIYYCSQSSVRSRCLSGTPFVSSRGNAEYIQRLSPERLAELYSDFAYSLVNVRINGLLNQTTYLA